MAEFRLAPGSPDERGILIAEAFVLPLVPPLSALNYLSHDLVVVSLPHVKPKDAELRSTVQCLVKLLNNPQVELTEHIWLLHLVHSLPRHLDPKVF